MSENKTSNRPLAFRPPEVFMHSLSTEIQGSYSASQFRAAVSKAKVEVKKIYLTLLQRTISYGTLQTLSSFIDEEFVTGQRAFPHWTGQLLLKYTMLAEEVLRDALSHTRAELNLSLENSFYPGRTRDDLLPELGRWAILFRHLGLVEIIDNIAKRRPDMFSSSPISSVRIEPNFVHIELSEEADAVTQNLDTLNPYHGFGFTDLLENESYINLGKGVQYFLDILSLTNSSIKDIDALDERIAKSLGVRNARYLVDFNKITREEFGYPHTARFTGLFILVSELERQGLPAKVMPKSVFMCKWKRLIKQSGLLLSDDAINKLTDDLIACHDEISLDDNKSWLDFFERKNIHNEHIWFSKPVILFRFNQDVFVRKRAIWNSIWYELYDWQQGADSSLWRRASKSLKTLLERGRQEFTAASTERKVQSLFQKIGFSIIQCTKNNFSGDYDLVLGETKIQNGLPNEIGEIDLLAINPYVRTIIVAECKSFSQTGVLDQYLSIDQFNLKCVEQLNKKYNWVRNHLQILLKILAREDAYSGTWTISPLFITPTNHIAKFLKPGGFEVLSIGQIIQLFHDQTNAYEFTKYPTEPKSQ